MGKRCKVTFIEHSSFLVETDQAYLLFDYWKGEIPKLSYDKQLYIFSSHSHQDHYSKEIYRLENTCCEVHYILSSEIKEEDDGWKLMKSVTFMDAHENKKIASCQVETLLSTDLGVAFIIKIDGLSIYHAGDLHWWEWPGEPEIENQAYIEKYCAEIDRIAGRKFDLAFVVLDPRQEEAGGRGMDTFLSKVEAQYVFPMHLWGDYGLIGKYKEKAQTKYLTDQIINIEGPGDVFELTF